jgi:hypothetical protein
MIPLGDLYHSFLIYGLIEIVFLLHLFRLRDKVLYGTWEHGDGRDGRPLVAENEWRPLMFW